MSHSESEPPRTLERRYIFVRLVVLARWDVYVYMCGISCCEKISFKFSAFVSRKVLSTYIHTYMQLIYVLLLIWVWVRLPPLNRQEFHNEWNLIATLLAVVFIVVVASAMCHRIAMSRSISSIHITPA